MESVCPNCNKLDIEKYICSSCRVEMTDLGRAQEVYQDDYTSNMPINDSADYCIHIFKCNSCHNKEKVQIKKITI